MRHFLIAALFLGSGTALCAQRTGNWSVVAPQGGSDRNEQVQLAWTLGEPATATGASGPVMLTEGFQQPVLQVVKILNTASLEPGTANGAVPSGDAIELFPNPTAGELHISIPDARISLARITLMDHSGQLLAEQRVQAPAALVLDLNPYPSGTYLLRIQSATGACDATYQVIRQQ